MENGETLYIVIPAYNEAENIADCVNDWYPIVQRHDGGGRSRLVVVDDGSQDNTLLLLKEMTAVRPLLEPMTKPNRGHGPAVLFGYRHAIAQGADYIFRPIPTGKRTLMNLKLFGRTGWAVTPCWDTGPTGETAGRGR